MDQAIIQQAIHNAVDGMQDVVRERVQEKNHFSCVAIVLATVDLEQNDVDVPMLLYITPECGIEDQFDQPLEEDDFITLLRQSASDYVACAVIRGYYNCSLGGPAVSVELPGNEFQLALPVGTEKQRARMKEWCWAKKDHQLDEPVLAVNCAH